MANAPASQLQNIETRNAKQIRINEWKNDRNENSRREKTDRIYIRLRRIRGPEIGLISLSLLRQKWLAPLRCHPRRGELLERRAFGANRFVQVKTWTNVPVFGRKD